jgi:TonB family protein
MKRSQWMPMVLAVFVFVLCGILLAQKAAERRGLWEVMPMSYPAVARLAQITGDVKLKLTIDKDGKITALTKLSGSDALATDVVKEIKSWRYAPGDQASESIIVIHYILEEPHLKSAPVPRILIHSPSNISVVSNYPLRTGHSEKAFQK